jgi:hypothetical protein
LKPFDRHNNKKLVTKFQFEHAPKIHLERRSRCHRLVGKTEKITCGICFTSKTLPLFLLLKPANPFN